MNSALLRHPIEIYELVTHKTEYGTISTSYEKKCDTKANVIFNSEAPVVSEGEIFYPINRTFIVRAFIPVIETDRIRWQGKDYRILSIDRNVYYNDIEIKTTLVNK